MNRILNAFVLVSVLALAFGIQGVTPARSAPGSITTTFAGGNGQDGVMFDVTAINTISITGFDISCGTTTENYQVWYKAGSYVGFENNQAAWTLQGAVVGLTCNGLNTPTYLDIGGIYIPAGQTYGIYITAAPGGSYGLDYTNGSNTYSNGDIQVDLGIGISYPFGSIYTPRIWNGTIYYNTVEPVVSLSATSFDFGDVLVGQTSASQTLTITNTGNAALDFTGTSLNTHPPFNIDNTTCGGFLNAGESCTYDFSFTTYSAGPVSGDFTFTSNAADSPHVISLSGNGVVVPPNGTNLLKKPSFDSASVFPTPWKLFGVKLPYASALDCNVFQLAPCSVYFPAGNRSAMQQVNRSGLAGDMYFFGLSSMANNAGGKYTVEVTFYNNLNKPMGGTALWFNGGTHGWETLTGYASPTGSYNKIIFRFYYQNASGRAWFDDAFLIVAP